MANIKLTLEQLLPHIKPHLLAESVETEGIDFKTDKKNGGKIMSYKPSSRFNIDDKIFNDDKSLRVRKRLLPKSNVMSYNLYDITNMNVNKGLKHNKDVNGNNVTWDESMNNFINRSVMYMKHIIGDNPVDIITYPQSSSQFNQLVTSKLLEKYPNSEGIRLQPELLIKNVRNIYVNVDAAREAGLNDGQIHSLQQQVAKWKKDEDIRDVRRKIDNLKDEIAQYVASRSRGRLPNSVKDKQAQIDTYNDEIKYLRKGMKGMDPTVGKDGRVKNWQIKSIDDKSRRSIEGIFQLNPQYQNMQYKLKGKHIVIFDDNLSSGATMDDVCIALQQLGAASIIPITLGTIAPTIYNTSERNQFNASKKLK